MWWSTLFLGIVILLACMRMRPVQPRTALVVVVGDVARSPRMCYHIASLVRHGWSVYVAGYFDTPLPQTLCAPSVHAVRLWGVPTALSRLPRVLFPLVALIKVPLQTLSLWLTLVALTPKPAVVLVQVPPAIPTLMVVQCARIITRSRLILDWHNLAYTLLALRLGPRSVLVRISELLERIFGRSAHVHLFVTHAMQQHLARHWQLRGHTAVLHDRPPSHFARLSTTEAHAFFERAGPSIWGKNVMRSDPTPALAVTSTSWTPDEDMHMLLDAASIYESRARLQHEPLFLSIVITGKGPLRAAFEKTMQKRASSEQWRHVRIETAWLAAEDYPRLLGAANVGISLHTSSSGLDLPMKVVDMLGCGLRVCALSFPCLSELIKPDINGDVFSDAAGLASCIERIIQMPALPPGSHTPFPGSDPISWDVLWDRVVAPLLCT